MYQSIGLGKILTLFAMIAGVVAAGTIFLSPPANLMGWWRPVSFGMTASSLLIVGIGQSPLFPWLCRLSWLRELAPDISGAWHATLHSNWPTIANLSGHNPGSGAPITAEIKVVARLLHVKIKFCSDTKYSKSKSVSVSVHRDEHDGDVRIYYTYENTTESPLNSDSSHHFGSAYVDVTGVGTEMTLKGLYWTNRNWTDGLNTAGTITWTRHSGPSVTAA